MKRTTLVGCAILATTIALAPQALAETREVDDFTEVNYTLPFSVEFVAGDETYVILEGDEDTIDEIVTEVRGDTLKVYKNDRWFDWSDGKVALTIGYVDVEAITMAGSGDAFAEGMNAEELSIKISGSAGFEIDELMVNDLHIKISGSGNVNLNDLEADSMSTSIAGSGDVEVTGRVVTQSISIAGSGDHNASELRSQEAEVNIKGSGDVEVWALATLDAHVMGSGDIEYYGSPQIKERVMGSGSVEHRGESP